MQLFLVFALVLVKIYPWIGGLKPPYSESPAGIFVILGRLAVVVPIALAAAATLVAAVVPLRGQAEP